MKKVLFMFTTMVFMLFAGPSFSASTDTTAYYMPISAQVYTECETGYACADVHVSEFSGVMGVTHGMFDFSAMETEGADGKDRKHYSAGVHFSYELIDGFTPFVGAGLYSGFENGEHKFQLANGDLTAVANIGFEAPVLRWVGIRMQVNSNKLTTAGIYAKW